MTQCFDSGAGLTATSAQEMRETVPLSSSPAGMLTVVSAHYPSPSHHGTWHAGRRVFYSDRVLTPSPGVNKSRQTGARSVVIFNRTAEGV